VELFEELVYNYCKWLACYKSRDLATKNWNEYSSQRKDDRKDFQADEEYKIFVWKKRTSSTFWRVLCTRTFCQKMFSSW